MRRGGPAFTIPGTIRLAALHGDEAVQGGQRQLGIPPDPLAAETSRGPEGAPCPPGDDRKDLTYREG